MNYKIDKNICYMYAFLQKIIFFMCMLIFKMVLSDEFRSGRPSEVPKDTHKVKEQPSEVQLPVTGRLVKQSHVPSVNASTVAISGKSSISHICFIINVYCLF